MKTTQAQLAHRAQQHQAAIELLAARSVIDAWADRAPHARAPRSAFGRADDRAYGQLVADFRAALAA